MRKLLATVIALSSIHIVCWTACTALRQAPEPVLVPATGQITELAVQFHRPGAEQFLPVFEQILSALDPQTVVHVVVSDQADEVLFAAAAVDWFSAGGPVLSYAHTGHAITSWMRDRLAVVDLGDGNPRLLAPNKPMTGPEARARDWTVPWTLGEHLDVPVQMSRYRFDGGDLIADSERAYVATAMLERNPDTPPSELLEMLEEDLGLPVLWLGADGREVPNHHIGMFLAPLGEGRVMVGDPDLALQVVDVPADHTLQVGGAPLRLDLSEARLDRFRNVADILEEAGLEVLRAPILPSSDDFVFLSPLNVLMDTRSDGLHVVLPVYGIDSFDDAAVAAWEQAGATVHPVDVSALFRHGGSVRCLVAPIARR